VLEVRWSLMWNATHHQLMEPSAPDCDRFFWSISILYCAPNLQVCPRVIYYLPCYVGHICGLQFYDNIGSICVVLTVKKKGSR